MRAVWRDLPLRLTNAREFLERHRRVAGRVNQSLAPLKAAVTDPDQRVRLARQERFDIVLLDLLIPKLPGIEVLRALRAGAATAALPVVISPTRPPERDKRHALELGAAKYYVKANLSLKAPAEQVKQLVANDASAR